MSKPPQHAFELTLRIGGEDWDYVIRQMYELSKHLEHHGPGCTSFGGGGGGCHSVEIQRRDVTPEQYRKELQEWADAHKLEREINTRVPVLDPEGEIVPFPPGAKIA